MGLGETLLHLLLLTSATIGSSPIVQGLAKYCADSNFMTTPGFYEEAADELALLCQTVDCEVDSIRMGTAWLPTIARDLGPSYVHVSPDGCRIGMGGGFHHYGYLLVQDKAASTDDKNAWVLIFYEDDHSNRSLTTVILNVDQGLTEQKFVQQACSGYDERIARGQHNINPFQEKFYFLLEFDQRVLARQVCEEATKAIPGHWWPRLTGALMDSTGPTAQVEGRRFRDWVEANPSLSHYVYLSYYHGVVADNQGACEAALESTKQPLTNSKYDDYNSWFLTYAAAASAFDNECYDTVVKIADRILQEGESDNYLYFDFLAMKAASTYLLGNQQRAIALLDVSTPSRPTALWTQNSPDAIVILREAITNGDSETAKAWKSPEAGELALYGLPIEIVRGVAGIRETP